MRTNVTAVYFNGSTKGSASDSLYQYDYGQYLTFPDLELPETYEVHFAFGVDETSVPAVGDANGVKVPDSCLDNSGTLYGYIYLHTGENDGETAYIAKVAVKPRAAIGEDQGTDEEQSAMTQAVAALNAGVTKAEAAASKVVNLSQCRVTPLAGDMACSNVVEVLGTPAYIEDFTDYADYGLTQPGWYAFARIVSFDASVTDETLVTGAAGYIAQIGDDHIDVAVRFGVAAESVKVVVGWDYNNADTYVFRATDLAVRNLDYRVTFFIYDIAPFTTWEYELTTDTAFVAGSRYFTRDGDTYTEAVEGTDWTAGDAIPAETYYKHSKVTFAGMTRNVTYRLDEVVDCPQEYILPEIEDDDHGCWFEIRLRHSGSFSSTLVPPAGVKVATEHTQAETAGLNMVNLHYSHTGGVRLWRFMNTHSSIPA